MGHRPVRIYRIPVLSLDGEEMPACNARGERREEAEGVAATAIRKAGNKVIVVSGGYVVIMERISDEYSEQSGR
jgi:hypothetical protein